MAIFQFAMFVYQRVLLSHRLSSFVLQGATCAKSCEGEKCGFKCHWHPVRGTDLAEGIGEPWLTMLLSLYLNHQQMGNILYIIDI